MTDTRKICELFFLSLIYQASMSPHVKTITKPLDLGEGPHWDSKDQALYFVDMRVGEIHRYLPEKHLHTSAVVGTKNHNKPVTFVIPVKNYHDTFLIGYGGDLATVEWNGVSGSTKNLKILCTLEKDYPAVRMNDGKVSPSGIVFAGSMAEKVDGEFPKDRAHLFAYDPQSGTSKVLLNNIGIGNGLAWNSDETIFYYVDSLTGQVKAYDYDSKNISLSNERVIVDFCKSEGVCPPELLPDGIAIDESGNLWVALNNYGKVYCIDPVIKKKLHTIDFDRTTPVSSVAFGGPKLDVLFVTSIRRDLSEEEKKKQPEAGCVFEVTGLNTKGLDGVKVNLP